MKSIGKSAPSKLLLKRVETCLPNQVTLTELTKKSRQRTRRVNSSFAWTKAAKANWSSLCSRRPWPKTPTKGARISNSMRRPSLTFLKKSKESCMTARARMLRQNSRKVPVKLTLGDMCAISVRSSKDRSPTSTRCLLRSSGKMPWTRMKKIETTFSNCQCLET